MNCKQGDLAFVIHSFAGNEGKIVRCVAFAGDQYKINPDKARVLTYDNWFVEPPLIGCLGNLTNTVRDAWLRPIRPQPDAAVDETLTWLPVPNQIPETA